MAKYELDVHPIHLGPGGAAIVQPPHTGDMAWYEGYGERHGGDGAEGRLVTMHTFADSWDNWEMHPSGSEVVLCLAGRLQLHQEDPDGSTRTIALEAGEYAVNAPGVWHTADVAERTTALFITSGLGTAHRPR